MRNMMCVPKKAEQWATINLFWPLHKCARGRAVGLRISMYEKFVSIAVLNLDRACPKSPHLV